MSRLHRQKIRQRFNAGVGAGVRDRAADAAVDDVKRFVASGQAAQAAVDKVIAAAVPVDVSRMSASQVYAAGRELGDKIVAAARKKPAKAKRAKRKAASARRRR